MENSLFTVADDRDFTKFLVELGHKDFFQSHKKEAVVGLRAPYTRRDSFRIARVIHSGRYVQVFEGFSLRTTQGVGIKVEQCARSNILQREFGIVRELRQCNWVPQIHYFGPAFKTGDPVYSYLVFELLGLSLQQLFDRYDKKFSLATVLLIALESIRAVKCLHEIGFAHRDLSPSCFNARGNRIFLSSFGKCASFIDPETTRHYKRDDDQTSGFLAAANKDFAPYYAHDSKKLSRRDDLESLTYILGYFLLSFLPWEEEVEKDKLKRKKIDYQKLLVRRKVPYNFSKIVSYVGELEFSTTPNYYGIEGHLQKMLSSMKLDRFQYDWMTVTDSK